MKALKGKRWLWWVILRKGITGEIPEWCCGLKGLKDEQPLLWYSMIIQFPSRHSPKPNHRLMIDAGYRLLGI
jgi:hypothetical protein